MKITGLSLYEWSLPLKKPLQLKDERLATRTGLLIRLTDQAGRVGWGETSPLPGFSNESQAEAVNELQMVGSELPKHEFPNSFDLETMTAQPLPDLLLSPSVRFGLELALWNLTTSEESQMDDGVRVNGLIVRLDRSAVTRAEELVAAGFRSIKLKIGRTSDASEIDLIRAISDRLPEDVSFRLDGNQSFDLARAVSYCNQLKGCRIEYIEEPLNNSAELSQFANMTNLPLALDESLSGQATDEVLLELFESASITAIVIKPTLIGGLYESLRLARLAAGAGVKTVISSAYESSLGLAGLARLAAVVAKDTAHGLDTLGVFENQLTEPAPAIASGRMTLPEDFIYAPNLSLIIEISND